MGCGSSTSVAVPERELEIQKSYNDLYERESPMEVNKNTLTADRSRRKQSQQLRYGMNRRSIGGMTTLTAEVDDNDQIVYCEYKKSSSGLLKYYEDYRVHKHKWKEAVVPRVSRNKLWVDGEFTKSAALGHRAHNLAWKRPQEFCRQPRLFYQGTTRFDIGQGAVGDCWFLSMLANVSENKNLMNRIFPDDAYPITSNDYNGMFHCKFWKFGRWCDVYTDDCLPIEYDNTLWGAQSATNNDEMWVPLIEKAFAKFHGSYENTYGGSPGDAYVTLTGGIAERIDLTHTYDPDRFHRRVTNALKSKSLVSCIVPRQHDGIHGLIGAHAYSLTGSDLVKLRGEKVLLFRVRNPWGRGEWTGPWSDKSGEWNQAHKRHVVQEDGEFWISATDFLSYFTQATICSLVPDFDHDGRDDGLHYKTCSFGEWSGPTASGFRKKELSPKVAFSIPKNGELEDGLVPIVIQLIQYKETRHSDIYSIRLDLFKVLKTGILNRHEVLMLQEIGVDNLLYHRDRQVSFRHSVPSGRYVAIPSTMNHGEESDFLVRVFTGCPLYNMFPVQKMTAVLSCHVTSDLDYNLNVKESWLAEWVTSVNAGGQIAHRTHHTNPQIEFWTNSDVSEEVITFSLMQDISGKTIPLGFKLYSIDKYTTVPLDYNFIMKNYDYSPKDIEGENGKFVSSASIDSTYILGPNERYVIIAFSNSTTDSGKFGLVAMSRQAINFRAHNLGS